MSNQLATLLILASGLTLSGCSMANTQHKMFPTADLIQKKTIENIRDVTVLEGQARPKRGCASTAKVAANGNAYATREYLHDALRKEAMAIGADVVIITSSGTTTSKVGTYGGGIMMNDDIVMPVLIGVACRTGTIWHGVRIDQGDTWKIRFLYEGSPGQKAGLLEGDEIVTVNGAFIGDDPFAWDREINSKSPGTIVPLQVIRAGSKIALSMTLEAPPEN